jgi:hypothetical protein
LNASGPLLNAADVDAELFVAEGWAVNLKALPDRLDRVTRVDSFPDRWQHRTNETRLSGGSEVCCHPPDREFRFLVHAPSQRKTTKANSKQKGNIYASTMIYGDRQQLSTQANSFSGPTVVCFESS